MKLLSGKQLREADAYTIAHEPISSLLLMERASNAFFRQFISLFPLPTTVCIVVAGNGNNGGDGLAVARMLHLAGYPVQVYLQKIAASDSADFLENVKKLQALSIPINTWNNSVVFPKHALIIDALLGTGLSKPCTGEIASIIETLNASACKIISIDLPSGLFADDILENKGAIIRAFATITFQLPKLSFLFAENHIYTGNFYVCDIGLHPAYMQEATSSYFLLTSTLVKPFLLRRKPFSHKGNFGHALLIAGEKGKAGAAILAARACLVSGAGLTTVHLPDDCLLAMQAALPEAMCSSAGKECIEEYPKNIATYSVLGIGPGAGTGTSFQAVLKRVIQEYRGPLVLDADALNSLTENKTWLPFLPKHTILTPHPKEFDRLFGKHTSSYERMLKQQEMAVKYSLVIILKGNYTSIAFPDGKLFFNTSGHPCMAKGGSGDVLTGMLCGLLARGYSVSQAVLLGVHLHGLAGEYAATQYGEESVLASQLTEAIPYAFKQVM